MRRRPKKLVAFVPPLPTTYMADHCRVTVRARNRSGAVTRLQVSDTVYTITPFYRAGAKACKRSVDVRANPHRSGSQRYEDWQDGHVNESADIHKRIRL